MADSCLLTHAHIITDGKTEILDGAMAFKETVNEVSYHLTDKILNKYEGRIYDLEGLIIMPSFVRIGHNIDDEVYDDGKDLKYHDKTVIRRYMNDDETEEGYLIAPYNSDLSHFDIIADLFHSGEVFDYRGQTLINRAFNNEAYVSIDIDDIDDDVFDFILRTISRNKLIVQSDKSSEEVLRYLKRHRVPLTDMALYTSLNLLRLLDDKRKGELRRGKEATFDIYDEQLNHLYTVKRGELKGERK